MIQRPSRCACSSGRRISAPRHSSAQKAGHCLWPGLPFGRVTATVVIIFCIVYLGMILGGLPFLQLDRTGIALLGAIALIGETLKLSFGGYMAQALIPVLLGLAVTWGLIAWQTRGRWTQALSGAVDQAASERREDHRAPFDRWQTAKGLSVAAALLTVFLFVPSWPRDVAALTGAGLLLMSRRLHSTKMLGLVDWELLILFIGLFVVNHALQQTGITSGIVADLAAAGVNLERPVPLFAATLVLSNVVSNVPAVMLLLPVTEHALAGPTLALVSTLSGNLLIVGRSEEHTSELQSPCNL